MFGEGSIAEAYNNALNDLFKERHDYDNETDKMLHDIKTSRLSTDEYLREILWELVYQRRRMDRP